MKKFLVLAAGVLLAFSVSAKEYSLTKEPWRLKPFEGSPDQSWMSYGFDDSSWVSQKQPAQWQMLPEFEFKYGGKMFYRTRFDFTPEPGKTYYLRFNGVFYYANLWLNGYYLGRHAGYFAPFEFDVTHQLRGRNVLAMEVNCPYEEGEHEKRHVTGVFGYWDVISWRRNPGGVWREVELAEAGTARFRRVWLGTRRLEGANAVVRLYGEMRSLPLAREPYRITVELEPENFYGRSYHLEFGLTGEPGENYFQKEFTLEAPELWNTWDRGKPNLYKVSVKALLAGEVQDQTVFSTGVRAIEKRCQKGERKEGLCWQFALNGRPIYIRGNNYAPGDAYLSRATRETYEQDLALARESNYNMLRVHSHVDRPEFYDAADAAGILLWQDFPLQGMYVHGEPIYEEAVGQAPEMVYLLGSHPSIALWNCHNEPAIFKTEWEVRKLDQKLKQVLEYADPTRPVNLASGLVGETDAHLYYGWYVGKADGFPKAMHYPVLRDSLAFITEFGAQAFPNYEHALRFTPPDINQVDWQDLQDRYMLQKKNMDKYLPLKPGQDLEQYVAATQEYQARLQKFHIDWIRSEKYRINWGAVSFLFNDPNPAVTWAVVDYWRAPKKAYYAMQTAFQPVYAFTTWRFAPYPPRRAIRLPVFVTNDLLETYDAKVSALVTFAGKELLSENWEVRLEADMPAKKIDDVSFRPEAAGDYELKLTITAPGLEKPAENLTVIKAGGK